MKFLDFEAIAETIPHISGERLLLFVFFSHSETDRVVFAAQPTAATRKQRQKRLPKNKEMSPMEMGDVPPISHHSHSTLSGQVAKNTFSIFSKCFMSWDPKMCPY